VTISGLRRSLQETMSDWRTWRFVAWALAVTAAGLAFAVAAPASTQRANRQAAGRDAATLLARVRLPSGSTRVAGTPAGQSGARVAEALAGVKLVDRHAWWLVPGRFADVLDYVQTHLPAGAKLSGSGASSGPGIALNGSETFAWPEVPGVLGLRWLVVNVTELRSGHVAIRADAEVQWIIPRPATERIPAQATALQVSAGEPGAPPVHSAQTTDPATVNRIRDLINRLPIVQPGVLACPLYSSDELVTFTFRAGAGGPVVARATELAQATEPTTACDPMNLWIGGREEDPLLGGAAVVGVAHRILGVDLAVSGSTITTPAR
jgi:hypothetical protein